MYFHSFRCIFISVLFVAFIFTFISFRLFPVSLIFEFIYFLLSSLTFFLIFLFICDKYSSLFIHSSRSIVHSSINFWASWFSFGSESFLFHIMVSVLVIVFFVIFVFKISVSKSSTFVFVFFFCTICLYFVLCCPQRSVVTSYAYCFYWSI